MVTACYRGGYSLNIQYPIQLTAHISENLICGWLVAPFWEPGWQK